MPNQAPQIPAIHHIVHEYANFVSSAEMVLSGKDIDCIPFKPPINTHISHAFYLNCRKLADFFQNKSTGPDDVLAMHFVSGYAANLPVFDQWRRYLNKQLAHVTYFRDIGAREMDQAACTALYHELTETWRDFRRQLPTLYADEITRKVAERKAPYPSGALSEFRKYNLD